MSAYALIRAVTDSSRLSIIDRGSKRELLEQIKKLNDSRYDWTYEVLKTRDAEHKVRQSYQMP